MIEAMATRLTESRGDALLAEIAAHSGRMSRRPTWVVGAFALLLSASLLPTAGCALNKGKVHDDTLAARQLSLEGIDARQRGQLNRAETLFSQATELCPVDERIRSQYAETLWESGRREQAVAHMEEAVRLSGGRIDFVVRLGEMYLEQGQLDRAAAQADQATRRSPQLAAAWALRGDVLRAQGRADESLASFHRAMSLQPHYPHVQLAVAEIYRAAGRPARALATLRTLADEYPTGETPQRVLLLQGLALKELHRYDASAKLLVDAAQQGEPSSELLLHLAETQWMAGDPVNARLTVQNALSRAASPEQNEAVTADLLSLQRRLSGVSRY
jgi:tetratricopeptide (TPR) repeat protein